MAEVGPEELGQAADAPTFDDAGTGPVETEPVEYDYIDPDELGDKYVKLKVDGEEVSVPLRDALQGYNRESVSTRRFQEASELRREAEEALRLQQAFQANPGLTVQILANRAGVPVEQYLGMTPAQRQDATDANQASEVDQFQDPLEQALNEERRARMALEDRIAAREADEILARQVEGMKRQYQIGDDEVRAVVQQAIQLGVGPEFLPMIYQSMAFQRSLAQQQAQQEVTQRSAADDAARRAAAAAATGVVSSGTGATNVSSGRPADGSMSLRDAFESAWDQVVGR